MSDEKPKRRRGKSLMSQLSLALTDAEVLQRVTQRDESYTTQVRLAQSRIETLRQLFNRRQADQMRKVSEVLKVANAEIEKLKSEIERLKGLLSQPAGTSDVVAAALARHEMKKGGTQCQ